MNFQKTTEGLLTLDFINQTERHVFLTGKAGTGKTTLLKQIITGTHKNVVVVAPTGIAALNAGGVTIHSMFQLPIGCFVPADVSNYNGRVYFETPRSLKNHMRMSREKLSIIRQMEVLVIDEVSMLRADLLDALDYTLRRVRKNNATFGGVQMLFIGDLMQLPPVVKNEEWDLLSKHYQSMFFFQAHAIKKEPPLYIELSTIFRQEDQRFIDLLNRLRDSKMTQTDWEILDQYVKPSFNLSENPGFILLTTHNYKADQVNDTSLRALTSASYKFKAEITGDFPDKIYPVSPNLDLKLGAQVMFVRNDPSPQKKYYNGKIGKIEYLEDELIKVRCDDDNSLIEVERHEWENEQYSIDETSKAVNKKVIGTFVQYPLRLAWAITVHKSQGLTFSKAALDVQDVFQPGQAYVAFSRLRSLDGLVLLNRLRLQNMQNTSDVLDYTSQEFDFDRAKNILDQASEAYMRKYIMNTFDVQHLLNTWKNHLCTYTDLKDGSIKNKFVLWANEMTGHITPLIDVSLNFQKYIESNFKAQHYPIVTEKIDGAKTYFIKQLEPFAGSLYLQLAAVSKAKKSRTYFNELMEIEEQFLLFLRKINNCHALVKAFTEGLALDKSLLDENFVVRYRERMLANTKELIQQKAPALLEDEDETIELALNSKKKKKTDKIEKVPTTDVTFQLWKEGKTIEEIAAIRLFTTSTIEGHFEKLIAEEKVDIGEVMEKATFDKIMAAMDSVPNAEGTKPVKEILGDKISFGQIKMVMGYRKLVGV
jgi:DNA-binding CsgD family transcriptional regulator